MPLSPQQFVPRPRALPMDSVTTDTVAASPSTQATDTLSFTDALRSDSTFHWFSDPSELSSFAQQLRADLLDPALWMGLLGTLLHILIILILAWASVRAISKVATRSIRRYEDLPALHPRRQRALTISNLLKSTARYVIWPIAIIMMLSELHVDVGALIATAGIAGLAIGFGAQTLVKDVISGVFLLFDDTIHVGDLVRIGTDVGTVEEIGIRLIRVRKFDGEMMMIPAGELRTFGNKSIGYVRAIVEVGLSYEQDLDTLLPIIERVAHEWAAERPDILLEEAPQVQSVMSFGESSVNVRVVIQVTPGEQFQAERDLRLKLKQEFDRLGIEIPFPRRTVYMRQEETRPPRTVQDDSPPTPPPDEPAGSD
jgi:small conductance mechanosensitive channel